MPDPWTRRRFLRAAALGAAGSALGGPLACRRRQAPAPPNLVYVFADQLRHDCFGYRGDERAVTPNIDRLAAQGISFDNCVSVSPVCAAHRASLFTGKYTSSTGMVVNELRIHPGQRCFGHVLTEAGYRTGYIGKWHLWANEAGNHLEPWNSFIPPGKYRLGFDGVWKAYNFHHNNFDSYYHEGTPEKVRYGERVYEPEAQFSMAMDFIRDSSRQERPFALFLSVGIPHDPWESGNVPREYLDLFRGVEFTLPPNWSDRPDPYMDRNTDPDRWISFWKAGIPGFKRVYYAMNASLDDLMGRMTAALDSAGAAENTILVFSSDHGEMFGENGRVFKMTFYESSARVPLLIRWPGRIPAGLRSDACINTPDIMPTLLGLLGLRAPESVEGRDLSRLARGEPGPEPDAAFLQGMGHTYLWVDGHEWRAVRDKRWTYARYLIDGSELLFDNRNDPRQVRNLAAHPDYVGERDRLAGLMRARMTELRDEFKPCSWYRDRWTDGARNIIASARGPFPAG